MRESTLHRLGRRTGLTRLGAMAVLGYLLATLLVVVFVSTARADDWHQETLALEAVPARQDHGDAPAVSPSPPPAAERFVPTSRGQRHADLVARHFPPSEVATALRVLDCESKGDPSATGLVGEQGLFQIRPEYHQWRTYRLYGRWRSLYDAEVNIAVAAALWADTGWAPWSCWRMVQR